MTDAEQQLYLAENLRPLHLPTDSLLWPLAPGWWFTAVIATALLLAAVYLMCKRYLLPLQRRPGRQPDAEQTLAAYYNSWQTDGDDTAYIHRVSTHLRKAAIEHVDKATDETTDTTVGRAAVAKLNGSAWVNWLQQTSGYPLSSNTKALLATGLYETISPPPHKQIHDEITHCLSRLTTHGYSIKKQSSRHA
jgi:hypothetical protein